GASVKLPDVTDVPLTTSPWNVTPFTVVLGTAGPPMLNAASSVPLVETSESPEIVVGVFHVMRSACAGTPGPRRITRAAIGMSWRETILLDMPDMEASSLTARQHAVALPAMAPWASNRFLAYP